MKKKVIVLITLLLLACTPYPIAKQYRQEAVKNAAVTDVQANPQLYQGRVVIWGGSIISAVNDSGGSELTILESPLDEDGYPYPNSYSRGRFKAQIKGFLDPLVFKSGIKVTLAGTVVELKKEKLDKGVYAYPLLNILQLRYWQNVPYYSPYYYYPYYPPYYYNGWDNGWPYYNNGFYFGYQGGYRDYYDYHGHRGYEGAHHHGGGHHH